MKRVYLVALLGIGALALAGCGNGGLGGNPEVTAIAVNEGADLQLIWNSVEGADGYRVYCDGDKIWEGRDTTYTIRGSSRVCATVEVAAYSGDDENRTRLDLTPEVSIIMDLVTHDDITGDSWVELDFTNGTATSTTQDNVNPDAPNTGWFVFYNDDGTPEFRDAGVTTVGQATMEVAFTDEFSSGYLAPDPGNYAVVRETSENAYHFFWADDTGIGYGDMDNNDYFGVIKVTNLTGTGPFTADLQIYIQKKVPGLRWVKF
ncbi:MAG: hypothetical protein ACO2OT_06410 [Candidatus Caldipriscus sp.]